MKFLDIDGPLIQFLSKMADLMWLNILTVVCCIPVFTAGASLTALNYIALKIVRGEEGYITRGFFKAFKDNFRQSTVIWCLFLMVAAVLVTDYRIVMVMDVEINKVIKVLILVIAIMALLTFMFVFPVQAKFSNPIRRTIWNAFAFSIMQLPRTVLMIILYILPYAMLYIWEGMSRILPVILVFFLSVPALLSAKLYNNFFLRLEERIREQSGGEEQVQTGEGEDERIFRDSQDEDTSLGQNN